MIATILSIALAGAAVDADARAPEAPKQYTPEIRGKLLDGTRPVASNVCLRQSGSEIRMCGYPDFSGNFYIPPHSVRPAPGEAGAPTFWLEIGRVTEAKKIAPIDASQDAHASIVLECNIARSSVCDRKSTPSRISQAEAAHSQPAAHPAK
jgi:hypothetical protein